MKKLILIFILLIGNLLAWQTYETESGGIGIYQNCVAGEKAGQITISKEPNKYFLEFITQNHIIKGFDYGPLGGIVVEIKCINDLGEGGKFIIDGRLPYNNVTTFGFKNDYKDFLSSSKWVKFTIPTTAGSKTFKFDFTGFNSAIKKVKE